MPSTSMCQLRKSVQEWNNYRLFLNKNSQSTARLMCVLSERSHKRNNDRFALYLFFLAFYYINNISKCRSCCSADTWWWRWCSDGDIYSWNWMRIFGCRRKNAKELCKDDNFVSFVYVFGEQHAIRSPLCLLFTKHTFDWMTVDATLIGLIVLTKFFYSLKTIISVSMKSASRIWIAFFPFECDRYCNATRWIPLQYSFCVANLNANAVGTNLNTISI